MAGKTKPKKADSKKADRKREKAAKRAADVASGRSGGLLPRTLAGVEVPQALRQGGSALVEFATSDLGRAVLAAALTAAAETILRHRPAGGEGGAEAGQESAGSVTAKDVVQSAALAAVGVMKEAARTVLPSAPAAQAASGAGQAGESHNAQGGTDRDAAQG